MLTDGLPSLRSERFDPARHHYRKFDCGVERLNNYLRLTAKKQQATDISRIFILAEEGSADVLGYYAVNLGAMEGEALNPPPKALPQHGRLPVLFLGQIAIDNQAQNKGFGKILMHHLFQKACIVAEEAGCYAILLDVISDGGDAAFTARKNWYAAFGFQPFASDPARLYMTFSQIRQTV